MIIKENHPRKVFPLVPPVFQLTCDFEGTLGSVSDGRGDSHRWGLALFQGAWVSQADGLFQFSTLGRVITALWPLSPPL